MSDPSSKAQESLIVMRNDQSAALEREVIMAHIRIAYLKLAIIVVLVMIIVWYIYSSMGKSPTERLKSDNATVVGPNSNWNNRTREPPTSQSTVPYMSGWYGTSAIKRPLGQINLNGQAGRPEQPEQPNTQEGFAPYASWLTPDIYNSGPAHDDHLSNKSHYGMYAPYDLSYLYPNNIELPAHRRDGTRSEHLIAYAQPGMDADDAASEYNVPEKQLESEAGLLFGLSNYDDVPVASGAPL